MTDAIRNFNIIEIDKDHKIWNNLLELATTIDKTNRTWLTDYPDYLISSHILVAITDKKPLGFLRFSIQQIGVEENRPPIIFNNQKLIEAKVLAFGVVKEFRNLGIGRALQIETMKLAKKLGCYQLRSKSAYPSEANYHLKISMNFGIQLHHKSESVYFIKAL